MRRTAAPLLAGIVLVCAGLRADTGQDKVTTASVSTCDLPSTFEGKVTMRVTTPGSDDAGQTVTESVKGGMVRIETEAGPLGAASAIVDTAKGTMTILMPLQKMYMVRPIPSITPPSAPAPAAAASGSFQKTSETAKLLGYDCVKYTFQGANESAELWVTEDLGSFAGLGMATGPAGDGGAAPSWEDALKSGNFFPLKVVSKSAAGTTRIETMSVRKETLPDADFAPPAGWQDAGAMTPGTTPLSLPTSN